MAYPANMTTVTVIGSFITPEGTASTGSVTFTASSWLDNSGANLSVPNSAVTKTLGTAGDFSVSLPITDDADVSPQGYVYAVSEIVDGVSRSYNISIPGTVVGGGTVFLADLTPVAAAGPEYYSLASSLVIGTVSTLAAGSAATASITGLAPSQTLNLGIPTGPTGPTGAAATIAVGSTSSVSNSGTASVTNTGTSAAGTFDFVLRDGPTGPTGPQGAIGPQGSAATVTVGTIGATAYPGPGTVTNSGSSGAAVLDFVLVTGPTGSTGPQGSAATITVGTIGATAYPGPGTVINSGTSGDAVLDFVLVSGEKGDTGATGATGPQGPSATIAVGTVGTVAYPGPGTVVNSGSSTAGTFDFILVTGDTGPTGPQGATGSTGPQGPAATVEVGTVGTVAYPGPGTVVNSGTSGSAVLDFTLVTGPQGATGATGPQGSAATITVGSVTAVAYGGTASVTNTGTSGSAVLDFVLVTGPQGAIGDLTATAPIDYTGNAFSLRYGAGLGTAAGGTLVADFSDATPQPLAAAGSAGSSVELARGDHAHARPTAADIGAVGTATTITAGTGLAGGGDLSTSRTLDVEFSDSAAQALGVAAAGTNQTASRSDHVHGMPSAADVGAVGTATAVNAGTALAGGGDLSTSRTLNVVLSDATPASVGTPAAGTAVTPSRADHVHEGTTLSSATPAALGTAAAGTATAASRGDHIHPTDGLVPNSLVTNKGDLIVRDSSAPARLAVGGTNGHRLEVASGETTGVKWAPDPVVLAVAVSDETTAITTGTAKVTFRMPFAMTVTAVRASLGTASTSGDPVFDINEGGSSILGTKLSIDANEKTSTTAASAATITDSALADDAEITIDIDTAGTGAKGAKVYIIGTRA